MLVYQHMLIWSRSLRLGKILEDPTEKEDPAVLFSLMEFMTGLYIRAQNAAATV